MLVEEALVKELRTCGSFNKDGVMLGATLRFEKNVIMNKDRSIIIHVTDEMRKIYAIIEVMALLGQTSVTSHWIPREGVNTIKEAYAYMQVGYSMFIKHLMEDRAYIIGEYLKGRGNASLASKTWPVYYILDNPTCIIVDGIQIAF